jgi:hypothetical protein
MSEDISLILGWPTGGSVTVRTSPMSTPTSLLSHSRGTDFILMRDRRILDGWLSLVSQGVQTGDTLIVLERGLSLQPATRITTFEAKTQSILLEVLKIKDSHYHPLETSRDAELLCKAILDDVDVDVDPWDGFLPPPDETVVAPQRLGTAPLPPLMEDDSGDEEEFAEETSRLSFDSLEEAGKFFSKNPWRGWSW